MPFGGTKSPTAVDELHVQGFVQHICLPMDDLPHVHTACKVRHVLFRLTVTSL